MLLKYLNYIIQRSPSGTIKLFQLSYIHFALKCLRMSDRNHQQIPKVDGSKYHRSTADEKRTRTHIHLFQYVLGQLRYFTDSTRPHINFHVDRFTAAAHDHTDCHWVILKILLRYLKANQENGVTFQSIP